MRIAITGSSGLLGSKLKKFFKEKGFDVAVGDRPDYNIASYESMKKFLSPDIKYLFNCAAFTDVPLAEEDQKQAYLVNAQAAGILAKVCLEYNIHLVHFSTDFVFDGTSTIPYKESDEPNPVNYYGLSKLHGERAIQKKMKDNEKYTIFRLQWLYGDSDKTFFSKILSVARQGKTLNIVSDEIGSPCSVQYVSDVVYRSFFKKDPRKLKGKIFHLTHNDYCSRYQCGKYFLEKMGFEGIITPIRDLPQGKVNRPKFGALDNTRLKLILNGRLGTWKKDLDDHIADLQLNNLLNSHLANYQKSLDICATEMK